jgi:DMSO reductase family type II enzyme chaperone
MGTAMHIAPVGSPRIDVAARAADATAAARCACYAVFSDLTASPHDVDGRASASPEPAALSRLPFELSVADLLQEFSACDIDSLKLEYSGLFEVGSQGPPAPIREDLITGQKGGTREEIVRFYDFFGYRLTERYAWAPDHLSVELEFLHFLCFHEASAAQDRESFQLAQADFLERHPKRWVPALLAAARALAPDAFYTRVLDRLDRFLTLDLAWQRSTVRAVEGDGGPG